MDWDYIQDLNPENLTEDEKEALFNTVIWFETDQKDLTLGKCVSLFKVGQEVLKYKGEQVEVLLHKLDELATQQGEEEARKFESDTDARSSRSRKSSSLEYQNLEQKYLELKTKYKKQAKSTEKHLAEIKNKDEKIKQLGIENRRLMNEIQSLNQDDAKSDISESVREQHKELVQSLHNKNLQLSDLLHDIEVVEAENVVLKEKLGSVRDELSTATKELKELGLNVKASRIELEQANETIQRLTIERDNNQDELNSILHEKQQFEREMEEFTAQVNIRVDEWKVIMEEKEAEIKELRSRKLPSHHSSISSLPADQNQLTALNKLIMTRDAQLFDLKAKLQDATVEMDQTTLKIKELKAEQGQKDANIAELNQRIAALKNQVKTTHERCQDLQEQLTHSEKIIVEQQDEMDQLMKGDGDYASYQRIQSLRSQCRSQEKQIMSLVKAANKLQDVSDTLERENESLRGKCGVGPEEFSVSVRQREVEKLQSKLQKLQEENLTLRLGQRQPVDDSAEKLKTLLEENEGLRRGMHEILASLNVRREVKEVKSETLEQLLRALDMRHVSGWYHPAMRLQAELYNQEGINTELRQQLRLARAESRASTDYDSILELADPGSLGQIQKTLQNIFRKLDDDSSADLELEAKLREYKGKFEEIRTQVALLYQEFATEKQSLIDKASEYQSKLGDLEQKAEISGKKLSLLSESNTEEFVAKSLQLAEENVILNRKLIYLENDVKNLTNNADSLRRDFLDVKSNYQGEISALTQSNDSLSSQLEVLKQRQRLLVSLEDYSKSQGALQEITVKYRELLTAFEHAAKQNELETKLSQELCNNHQAEKAELEGRIKELYQEVYSGRDADISQKLAEAQMSEMREKQRANHTNNLYELVKEQLHKSDERLKQLDNYCKDILQKNLKLQEQLSNCETKLINFPDVETHRKLQQKSEELSVETGALKRAITKLETDLSVLKGKQTEKNHWELKKNQELLGLKHQIVDLQATTDQKVQIARLNNELSYCQLQETDQKSKLDQLTQELEDKARKLSKLQEDSNQRCKEFEEKEEELLRKNRVLQEIVASMKQLYVGCVPLPSSERFIEKIKQSVLDKSAAFLSWYESEITAHEVFTLKREYERRLKNLEQLPRLPEGDILEKENFTRKLALKNSQLEHIFERVKLQDQQIIKLEEELFSIHQINDCERDVACKPNATQTDCLVEDAPTLLEVPGELQELKAQVAELEVNLAVAKKQLGDKQSQIVFYERHILELQSKAELVPKQNTDADSTDELRALKCSLTACQESVKQRDEEILKYQSLLKEDRDKHSLAASLMRDDLRKLQKALSEEKQTASSKAALEQYFTQVHALEDQLSSFRTNSLVLNSQLQASRQEAVRWKSLANERLATMQKLGEDLESMHTSELVEYKTEAEKWREEVANLKQVLARYKNEMELEGDLQQIVKDKDNQIHELNTILRQAKNESKRHLEQIDSESTTKLSALETTKDQLVKEHETIKKRFDQLLNRERSAREEIRELKGKLLKKPILSARSDKSEKSIKEQLQKKIAALEKEIEEVKESLAVQISINDSHRVAAAQDFERWNKQKHYQQLAEKLKTKLRQKESDFEKLQETAAGYRILIERLERDKYNLETKMKSWRSCNALQNTSELEVLRVENLRLIGENEALTGKLETQQRHAGGLGAALLQEKLEGQERKLAVLELAAKGSVEIRAEIERLQSTIASVQKANLCLEAESLELKLDLEKSTTELPHLREQIQHLENYISVLKSENRPEGSNPRKTTELEHTIFVLKRVVEKLQVENKRLLAAGKRCPDRVGARESQRLKEQYCEAVEKIRKLGEELKDVREELEQKAQLLNRVKVLLQRAAAKEKALLAELDDLKMQKGKSGRTASV